MIYLLMISVEREKEKIERSSVHEIQLSWINVNQFLLQNSFYCMNGEIKAD